MSNTPDIKINNEGVYDSIIVNKVKLEILPKSYEYNDLLDQLAREEKYFKKLTEDEQQERLETSEKINNLKEFIERFKSNVLQLAEQFNRIEINTDRLKRAKEFFDKGEIGEARALLNDDNETIQSEEEFLWAKRDVYQKEIESKLKEKAVERLIQALLNQSDYANPNWFADTCQNFERSIKSDANKTNVFQYAIFLQQHNDFTGAEKYYLQYLNDFAHQLSVGERANILNNLAVLHTKQNQFEEALKEYEEALQIRRSLAEVNPNIYLPAVATTLNNLAILHKAQNKYEEALKEYEEALQIWRSLAEVNPNAYLPDVAMTLNNLANLHRIQNKYEEALKEYKEALQIRRSLAEVNPNAYLPDMAMTLNNLAVLHENQNKYEEALKEYEEALQIYRGLAEVNPNTYLPFVATTLNNLAGLLADKDEFEDALQKFEESTAIYHELTVTNFQTYFPYLARNLVNLALFYQIKIQQREKSIAYAIEAIMILLPYIEKVPFTQEYFVRAWAVLQDWNLSDEEIQQLIEEKMKETGENQS